MKSLLALVCLIGLAVEANAGCHRGHRGFFHRHQSCACGQSCQCAPCEGNCQSAGCVGPAVQTNVEHLATPGSQAPAKPARIVQSGKVFLLDPASGNYFLCPNCR